MTRRKRGRSKEAKRRSKEGRSDDGKWVCKHCTFRNGRRKRKCEMCDLPRIRTPLGRIEPVVTNDEEDMILSDMPADVVPANIVPDDNERDDEHPLEDIIEDREDIIEEPRQEPENVETEEDQKIAAPEDEDDEEEVKPEFSPVQVVEEKHSFYDIAEEDEDDEVELRCLEAVCKCEGDGIVMMRAVQVLNHTSAVLIVVRSDRRRIELRSFDRRRQVEGAVVYTMRVCNDVVAIDAAIWNEPEDRAVGAIVALTVTEVVAYNMCGQKIATRRLEGGPPGHLRLVPKLCDVLCTSGDSVSRFKTVTMPNETAVVHFDTPQQKVHDLREGSAPRQTWTFVLVENLQLYIFDDALTALAERPGPLFRIPLAVENAVPRFFDFYVPNDAKNAPADASAAAHIFFCREETSSDTAVTFVDVLVNDDNDTGNLAYRAVPSSFENLTGPGGWSPCGRFLVSATPTALKIQDFHDCGTVVLETKIGTNGPVTICGLGPQSLLVAMTQPNHPSNILRCYIDEVK